jgi:pSer/pThr/pTyr-binding forkhead associated (FHA) protein
MSAKPDDEPSKIEAFLIMEGTKVFIIDNDDFRIGRKNDNDIIIDDPHVSRYHAKIRYINKKYVLLDLNSTVGTSVNGNSVEAKILKSGDVLSVGGVPIIFGIGTPGSPPEASQPTDTDTGPTDSSELEELDRYIDMFRGNE